MGFRRMFTGMFITLSLYLLLIHHHNHVLCATGTGTNVETPHRSRNRPVARFSVRPVTQYARLKPAETFSDFFVDDDDLFELAKRQISDDYGHLRFGKRGEEQFDDYGHMRFGRSGSD